MTRKDPASDKRHPNRRQRECEEQPSARARRIRGRLECFVQFSRPPRAGRLGRKRHDGEPAQKLMEFPSPAAFLQVLQHQLEDRGDPESYRRENKGYNEPLVSFLDLHLEFSLTWSARAGQDPSCFAE